MRYVQQYCGAGEATDDNMAHAPCMLENKGYRCTLRLCSLYCSSTATMIARTRPSVTLCIQILPCYVLLEVTVASNSNSRISY